MTKEEFLKGVSNWDNHRYFLWEALEATKHKAHLPVLELGCGAGSTPFLRQYCQDEGSKFMSYESDKKYADQFGSTYIENWDMLPWRLLYRVVLVDEAPGEHRRISIQRLKECAQIIIVHDSEPEGWNASDYKVRMLFDEFLYMKDWKSEKPNAWATALSQFIDVSSFGTEKRKEYSEPTNY